MTTAILSALPEEQGGLVQALQAPECITHAGRSFWRGRLLGQPVLGAPYHWVQTPHYLISADRWDDRDALHAAVMATAGALPCPKPRKPKAVAR